MTVLSAMDDAINDGVDILSLSLGPVPPQPIYFEHAISIGAFHSFRKGVLVSCSAGNSFFPKTATNVAPWILSVAASSLDREFDSNIYLGNSRVLQVTLLMCSWTIFFFFLVYMLEETNFPSKKRKRKQLRELIILN